MVLEDGRPVVSFGDWQAVQHALTAAVAAAWRAYAPDRLLQSVLPPAPNSQPGRHSAPTTTGHEPRQVPQHSRQRISADAEAHCLLQPGAAAWRQQGQRPFPGIRSLSTARLVSDTRSTVAVASAQLLRPLSAEHVTSGSAAIRSAAVDATEAAIVAPSRRTGAPAAALPPVNRDTTTVTQPELSMQPRDASTPILGGTTAADQQLQSQLPCSSPQPGRRWQGSTSATRSKHSHQAAIGSAIRRPSSAPPHPAKRLKAAHRNPKVSMISRHHAGWKGMCTPDAAGLRSKAAGNGSAPAGLAVPQPQRAPLKELDLQHSRRNQQRPDTTAPVHSAKQHQRHTTDAGAVRRAALTSVRRRRTSASAPLDWAQPPEQQQQQQQQQRQQPVSSAAADAAAGAISSSGADPGRQPLSEMVAAWKNPVMLPPAAPPILTVASMAQSDSRIVPTSIAREDLKHVHVIGQASAQ